MPSEPELSAIVDRLIAKGESDDDIQFIIQDYRTTHRLPAPGERERNMAAQAGINTDPKVASNASLKDTVKGVGRGVKNALFSMVDPRTYAETSRMLSDVMLPTSPEAVTRTLDRGRGMLEFGQRVLSGDPEAGGEALTGLVVPELAGRMMPRVPNAMAATGRGMERLGQSGMVQKAAQAGGIVEAVGSHSPAGVATGMAIAAAPQALEVGGRMLQSGAERLGATPRVNVPVRSPNAGGKLVRPPARQTEAQMATALEDVRSAKPEAVELKPYTPADDPLRMEDVTGRSVTGEEIYAARNGRMGAATLGPPEPAPMAPEGRLVRPAAPASLEAELASALKDVSSTPAPAPSAVELAPYRPPDVPPRVDLEFVGKPLDYYRTPKPKAGAAAPAAPAPVADPAAAPVPDDLQSPIAQQLLASLAKQEPTAAPTAAADTLAHDLMPPSRSRGSQGAGSAPSATKGLTRNDMEAIGENPDIPLRRPLTLEEMLTMQQARQSRSAMYREAAARDRQGSVRSQKD